MLAVTRTAFSKTVHTSSLAVPVQTILQELKSRGLKKYKHLGTLARSVKTTKYREEEFMALLCEEASARMVQLAAAASEQDAQVGGGGGPI